jgi:hypothetical protein
MARPDLAATRSLVPSSFCLVRRRVGFPVSGSSSITLEALIGPSKVMIPPSGLSA